MSIDLFTPLVPTERFHPAFEKLIRYARAPEREVLEEWARGFVDRDGKFAVEFQTSFDSSFWELYLFAAFKELGFKCDFTKTRPDFCITSPDSFTVEAVVSLHADGAPSVPEGDPLEYPQDLNEFNRLAMIRLLNSIHAKHRKFINEYRGLNHVKGRPFVLAVAPFDRPKFHLQAQRAIEAVLYRYYVDENAFLAEGNPTQNPIPRDLKHVIKDSGAELPLGLFCDNQMSGISAVIHSTSATWTKVTVMSDEPDAIIDAVYENRREGGLRCYRGPNIFYEEHLLDGLRVYHNPFAEYPLDPDLFGPEQVFQATAKGVADIVPLCPATHVLACHSCLRLQQGMMEKVLKTMSPDRSFWHGTTSSRYRDHHRMRQQEQGKET